MKTLTRLLAALLTALLIVAAAPAAAQDEPARDPMADLVLSADELTADAQKGTTLDENSLLPANPDNGLRAAFTTQIIEAPIPFNAVVPHWSGDAAEQIELRVRTGPDGRRWGDWLAVHANQDWMEPGEAEIVGEMVLVPAAGQTHRYVQVQVLFNPHAEATTFLPGLETELLPGEATPVTPTLRQLRLTFIDTTAGPTADELIDLQQQLDDEQQGLLPESADAYPKPFVVSRDAWCTHADCDYSDGLEHHPVSHLIVHHTVSNNSSSDWPAVVRAIWNFHTFGRGWGDIGYNYLIDPNGVIYEGHNGGDDVVGTHASGANKGSMAAALLGTFTLPNQSPPGIRPPEPMLNSLVALFAWKADQRDINVFDADSALPNITWGLPRLMGHRDVYGTTICPGDQAHLLIPWLRDQIADRIGLVDPFLYADENTSAFSRSNSSGDWLVPPYLCGFNNHAWYAWAVTSGGVSGEWRPNVPVAGRYRIDVHIPYCNTGRSETSNATYTIVHAGGTTTRTISQQANVGLWATLGEFDLSQGNGNVVRLSNRTNAAGPGVWFDAIRLLPIDAPPPPPPAPTAQNLDPTADRWRNNRAVTFTWQVNNPETVYFTTLQVATDATFLDLLVNQSWWGVVTTHSHAFDRDYAVLYWRVLLSRQNAPVISSAPTRFSLDATAPQSAVQSPLFILPGAPGYRVTWQGEDATAGVDRYHIDVRPTGGAWTRWLSDTRLRSADFLPPNAAAIYEFRAQAVDAAGNVEPPAATADATTANAVTLDNTFLFPIIAR
jgi:hypothetical protein